MSEIKFSCPECGVSMKVRDQFAGKKIKCPKCGGACPVPATAAQPPAAPPAPAAKPNVPNAEMPAKPHRGPGSGSSTRLRSQRGQLSSYQTRVYSYLTRGLERYRQQIRKWPALKGLGFFPLLVSAGAGSALLLMLLLYHVLLLLSGWLGDWTNYGLYLAPLVTLVVGLLVRPNAEAGWVSLHGSTAEERFFTLGRFDRFTNPTLPITYLFLFGLFLGLEIGLFYWTHDHGGLEIEGGLLQCVLLGLDHVCQVLTVGLLAFFNVHLTAQVPSSTLSSVIFWIFNLGYVAMLVLFGFDFWRRDALVERFKVYPADTPDPESLATWAEWTFGADTIGPGPCVARFCLDECLFLLLAAQYLRGHYDLAREIAHQFPWCRIAPVVLEYFLDAEGQPIFTSAAAC